MQYLGRHGVDIERLFELTELPTEFLQDPSCWLKADDVETFLSVIEREFSAKFQDANIMTTVGHSSHELRAWGVLDGVLKMMQKPSDIYSQPQRFISYFVSPAPPVGNVQREGEGISFDLPISNLEFPLATEYLRAALEALPLYVGKNMASVRWNQTTLSVSWSEAQASLLAEPDFVVKPELIQELVGSLEEAQRELERQKQIVFSQAQELEQLKAQKLPVSAPLENGEVSAVDEESAVFLRNHILRLSDYLTRAQQLVTLLVKQDRMDRQVQEAMRRVDWDFISVQYREIVEQSLKKLETLKASGEVTPRPGPIKSARKRSSGELELSVTN